MKTEGITRIITAFESPERNLTARDFFTFPFRLYRAVGFKIFHWDEYDIMTKWDMLRLSVALINLGICFFGKVFYPIVEEFENEIHMTQWCLYLAFATDGVFRIVCVTWGRKTLDRILKTFELIFPRNTQEYRDFKINYGFKYIHHHTRIMVYMHMVIAFMFLLFPIVESAVEYKEKGIFVHRLPYIITYPYDISLVPIYICAYVSQFFGGLSVSSLSLGTDALLVHSVYMVVLNFEYLSFRIEHFEPKDFEHDMAEIKFVLERHFLLYDLSKAINSIFNITILLNYMIAIAMIVLLAVQVVTGSDLLSLIKFGGFLVSSSVQVFYFSFMGNLLMERSLSVGESLMGQKWYMTDVRYQRMLVLAIARSQRPAHLTAFKFFVVSMESFSNLMTTAYQFFTLLKTRMEEDRV